MPVHLRRMSCLLGPVDTHLGWLVVSSLAGLIITVTDGEGEVIEREAGCAIGPGPVAHDAGRSLCASATSAGLDGADFIRRC